MDLAVDFSASRASDSASASKELTIHETDAVGAEGASGVDCSTELVMEEVPAGVEMLASSAADQPERSRARTRSAASTKMVSRRPLDAVSDEAEVFVGEWDDEGVFMYQAFCDDIADWALAHQQFGGPRFCPKRMTWIKPSFAWVLYRSGYGHKNGQTRILKVKLSHESIAEILSHCQCLDTNRATRKGGAEKDREVSSGVAQWDPGRDLMRADERGGEPRKQLRGRAIQIGLKGWMSELYVSSVISIQDVTELAHRVGQAHAAKKKGATAVAMALLHAELPTERPYMPRCAEQRLVELALLPGPQASAAARLGRGKAA